MAETSRPPGRPRGTNADRLVEEAGVSREVAELRVALNALIDRAGLSQTHIRLERYPGRPSQLISDSLRRKSGPDKHIVQAIVEICLTALGEDIEVGGAEYFELWNRTPLGLASAKMEPPHDQAGGRTQELLEHLLEALVDGQEADLAAELMTGALAGPELSAAVVELGLREPEAVVALLLALEHQGGVEIAQSIFDQIVAADFAVAEAVRGSPAAVLLVSLAGSPDPLPPIPLPPQREVLRDLNPVVTRGRRLASLLGRGDTTQPVLEFLAAPEKPSKTEDDSRPGVVSSVGELLHAVIATADGPTQVGRLLVAMSASGHRAGLASCFVALVMGIGASDADTKAVRDEALAAIPAEVQAEALLELCGDPTKTRVLTKVMRQLPPGMLVDAFRTDVLMNAGPAGGVFLLLVPEAAADEIWASVLRAPDGTGPSTTFHAIIAWNDAMGGGEFADAARRLLALVPTHGGQVRQVLRLALEKRPPEAALLLAACEEQDGAAAARLLAQVLAETPEMVERVADLAISTEQGVPVQLLQRMLDMALGEAQAVLIALVLHHQVETYRILVRDFRTRRSVVEQLLTHNATRDPSGPWLDAKAALGSGQFDEYLHLLESHDRGDPVWRSSTCSACHGLGEVMHVQRSFLGEVRTATTCPVCKGQKTVTPYSVGEPLERSHRPLNHDESMLRTFRSASE